MVVSVEFESDPRLVATARAFVRTRLEQWEVAEHIDSAVLVASELVTNAVLHARTAIKLTVALAGEKVRIEVHDQNSRQPMIAATDLNATSGRGLSMVNLIARSWGVENHPDGKILWAELGPLRPEPAEDCIDLRQADTVEQALNEMDPADHSRSLDQSKPG